MGNVEQIFVTQQLHGGHGTGQQQKSEDTRVDCCEDYIRILASGSVHSTVCSLIAAATIDDTNIPLPNLLPSRHRLLPSCRPM